MARKSPEACKEVEVFNRSIHSTRTNDKLNGVWKCAIYIGRVVDALPFIGADLFGFTFGVGPAVRFLPMDMQVSWTGQLAELVAGHAAQKQHC